MISSDDGRESQWLGGALQLQKIWKRDLGKRETLNVWFELSGSADRAVEGPAYRLSVVLQFCGMMDGEDIPPRRAPVTYASPYAKTHGI